MTSSSHFLKFPHPNWHLHPGLSVLVLAFFNFLALVFVKTSEKSDVGFALAGMLEGRKFLTPIHRLMEKKGVVSGSFSSRNQPRELLYSPASFLFFRSLMLMFKRR